MKRFEGCTAKATQFSEKYSALPVEKIRNFKAKQKEIIDQTAKNDIVKILGLTPLEQEKEKSKET